MSDERWPDDDAAPVPLRWRKEPGDLNLPFQGVAGEPVNLHVDTWTCGGVVIRAAVIDHPEREGVKLPVLLFDFHLVTGQSLPPITLVVEEQELRNLQVLVAGAAEVAIQKAKELST